MSDFDEVYLPFLLRQFRQEIERGLLCVLVAHSGNKYLHLGTDKGLAALLYGYFNKTVFGFIEHSINRELAQNRMGDFDANSPTILLTQSFLKNLRKEILFYSPFIRHRTAYIYSELIPAELKTNQGYFGVYNPFSDARYLEEAPACSVLENNCGFITIELHNEQIYSETIHQQIYKDFNVLLHFIGIDNRDGYGFSQTTKIKIEQLLRLSIGTESLSILSKKMQLLCDYLLAVNQFLHINNSEPLTKKAMGEFKQSLKDILPKILAQSNNEDVLEKKTSGNSYSFFNNLNVKELRNQVNARDFSPN